MFSKLFQEEFLHKEGDLYKIVTAFGVTFELRYGYYGDCDRKYEPDVIYPDFLKDPVYTEDGAPFVTMMQDACESYKGKARRNDDTTCAECKYFSRCEELLGICTCEKRINK